MSEEDFREQLFTELAENPGPPLGSLVADATAAGVRQRRRNRIVQTVAGTAGVTAVALVATAVAGGIGGGAGRVSAASGSAGAADKAGAATTLAAPATTSPAGAPADAKKGWGGKSTPLPPLPRNWQPVPAWMTLPDPAHVDHPTKTTAKSAALLLEQLITATGGPGAFSHVYANADGMATSSTDHSPGFSSDLYWNDATLAVRYAEKPVFELGCGNGTNDHGNVCYDYKLADGTEVNYFNLPGVPGASETKAQKGQANLTIQYRDGRQVMIMEINGPETGSTGPTRADQPFTEQQLWQIAADGRWSMKMDSAFVAQAAQEITLVSDPF